MGNQGRTIFSDNRLLVCRAIVEYLLKEHNDCYVYRLGEGAEIQNVHELSSVEEFQQLVNANPISNRACFEESEFTNSEATVISYDRLKLH